MKISKEDLKLNMKKGKIIGFFGRQLSRLRLGQGYYSLILTTINSISLVSLAFTVTLPLLLVLFPVVFIGAFTLGYGLDRWDISALDYRKTTEITGRFVNALDLKNFDMRIIQIEANARAIQNENFNISEFIEEKRIEFLEKWNP